jgi:hypothetical protein
MICLRYTPDVLLDATHADTTPRSWIREPAPPFLFPVLKGRHGERTKSISVMAPELRSPHRCASEDVTESPRVKRHYRYMQGAEQAACVLPSFIGPVIVFPVMLQGIRQIQKKCIRTVLDLSPRQ